MSLKALILVGGFGTRLRPLTLSKSKPLVEFINKPILVHQIEELQKVGVDEIVLAVNYQHGQMEKFLKEAEDKYKIKLTISLEDKPLGTAGPIGLAKKILEKTEGNEIFVFNADVTCKFPLKEMLEFHRKHGKEGTIAVTEVKDPSKYGVLLSDENRKVTAFIEKPQEYVGNNINAGIYILNKSFLKRVEPVPTSIEREIFPQMAKEGELYSFLLEDFWADIGQPKDYLKGTELYLDNLKKCNSNLLVNEKEKNYIKGNVVIGSNTKIDESSLIGPNVVIGNNCTIMGGVRLKNCVLLDGCVIGNNSFVSNSIIGWNSVVGKWVRIEGTSVFGESVTVKDEILISGNIILPFVTIKNNTHPGDIILC